MGEKGIMKFENIKVFNFEGALRGMRNPKNSWDKSDSFFGLVNIDDSEHDFDVAYAWAELAMKDEGRVKYEVMSAKLAMTLYTSGHSLLAWMILDPYTPHETR